MNRLVSDSRLPCQDMGSWLSLEAPDPSSQLGKVKMGQTIDQTDDSEITNPNPAIEELGLQNYFFCCLGPPLQDHTPTTAQWVGLFYRVFRQKASAYADFAVWTPYGDIVSKEMKYVVWKETGFGEHRQVERKGPGNLLQWEASWMVFRVAMIGLGLAAPAILDAYLTTFKRLVGEFPECWGLLCQAEDHARKHKAVQFRRSAEHAFYAGESWAKSYNPTRPWESTFLMLASREHAFWLTEVLSLIHI